MNATLTATESILPAPGGVAASGVYRRCGEPNWAAPVIQSCAVSTRSFRVRRPLSDRMRSIG
jgi:hypothetical protein